jgi:glycosyltransferase involved in cell wall biosynthesis
MPPAVSIGLPVYNSEKFVASAIESLLGQRFGDFQVLVSDNASTDGTEDIVRSLTARDSRFAYRRNPENVGLVRNFRLALAGADGRYLKWMAADDVLAPDWLERCVAALDGSEASLAVTWMSPIDEAGKPLTFDEQAGGYRADYGEWYPLLRPSPDVASAEAHLRLRAVIRSVRSSLIAPFFYGLMRAIAFDRATPLGLYLGAEKVLLAELSLRGPIVYLADELAFRRLHPAHFGGQALQKTIAGLDTSPRARHSSGGWQQAAGYVRAIAAAPIGATEKARAGGELIAAVADRRVLRRLLPRMPGRR